MTDAQHTRTCDESFERAMHDGDVEFERAMHDGDVDGLAAEIERRLDACLEGTHIHFRRSPTGATVWKCVARGSGSERRRGMARSAATRLTEPGRGDHATPSGRRA